MSRSSAGTHGVNLMPLLDVLLCTMGTLIVILGVINREARLHPAKRLPGKTSAKAQQSEQMVEAQEDLQLRIQELNAAKEKTLADLASSRTRLAGVEDSSRHLEDQLQSLVDAAKQLPGAHPSDDPQRDKLRLELTQLNERRMQLELDLQKARANSTRRQPGYAVIPFDEMYKTSRRPIYIECRGDSVILQPEGIVFGPPDFLGPGGPSNPLASALRAAQEYWRNAPRPAPDMPNEPYPLLLVRPNGIIGYYLVRDAMSSWDAEFGYELVGEDWKLEYPNQPDPQLQEMENRAVAEARQQLQWLAQVSPELFSRKASKVEYHVSPFRGGIVRDGGPSLGNDPFADDPLGGFGRAGRNGNSAMPGMIGAPGGSPANGVSGGPGNGFGGPSGMGGLADARGNSAFAANAIGGGTGQGGMGSGGSYRAAAGGLGGSGTAGAAGGGNSGPDIADIGPRYAGAGNGTAGFGNGGGNIGGGTNSAASGSIGGNTGGGGSVGGNSGDGMSGGSGNMVGASGGAYGNGSQIAAGGNPNYGNGGGATGGGNSAQLGNGASPTIGTANSASGAANNLGGVPGSGGGSPSQYGGVLLPNSAGGMMSASSSNTGSPDGNGSPGSSIGSASGGQYASSAGQYSGGAGGGGSPYGSSSPTGSAGGSGGTSPGSDSSSGGSGGASSSSMGSSGGDSGSSGGGPSMTFDFSQQQQQNAAAYDDSTQQQSSSSHSMSKNRGKNWALPTSHTASVPVQRPIRVECWSDHLVLVPDTRDQQPQVIPLGQRTEDALEPLVGAVRTYTRSWGIAGRSMYWKPQLVLNVNPNAEARAADLQTLLADSGWDVKRK